MNHVWGLFPIRSGNAGDQKRFRIIIRTICFTLMAAIPSSAPLSAGGKIGWNFGDGNVLQLSLFYRFCAGGVLRRRDAGGRRGDGAASSVDWRETIQRPSLARCMVLPAMSRRRCFKWSGGALSHGYGYICALVGAVALLPAICCDLGIPTFAQH